jgi:hypothetical protein
MRGLAAVVSIDEMGREAVLALSGRWWMRAPARDALKPEFGSPRVMVDMTITRC